MPVLVGFNTNRKPNEPFVNFDKDYYYLPVGLMARTDISMESKFTFSFILTEYLPVSFECAMKHLANVTVDEVVNKYRMPLLQAGTICNEVRSLAPNLLSILKGDS
ncbi:MAG: hypothetical protein NC120_10175 [Ruminococcus sp.]|nr:hypothetical protein [Ruminococcus sp.]